MPAAAPRVTPIPHIPCRAPHDTAPASPELPNPARNTKLQSHHAYYADMLPQPSTTLPARQRTTFCGERVRKQRRRAHLTAKLQAEAQPTVTRNHGPEDAVESVDALVARVFEAPDELESTEAGHAVEGFREVRVDRAAVRRLQPLDLARRPPVLLCVCVRVHACAQARDFLSLIGEICDVPSLDQSVCHTIATPASRPVLQARCWVDSQRDLLLPRASGGGLSPMAQDLESR